MIRAFCSTSGTLLRRLTRHLQVREDNTNEEIFQTFEGQGIVKYLGVITLLCAMVVIDGVAIGMLGNMNEYLHLQPVKGAEAAVASVGSPTTYALNATASGYNR